MNNLERAPWVTTPRYGRDLPCDDLECRGDDDFEERLRALRAMVALGAIVPERE